MPDIRLVPECHADTALVRFLTDDDPRIIHAAGFPEVGVTMRRAPVGTLLIGFVDNDKRVPPYFDDFELLDSKDNVLLKKKRDSEIYLIVIHKAIESFLIWNARETGVEITDFGFSEDIKQLGNRLKSIQIESSESFQNLLESLDEKNAPGFARIRAILDELINKAS